MDQRRYLSLAEAAALAHTSIDTIRRKLRSGELTKAQTNKRGVFVDLSSLREVFELADTGLPDAAASDEKTALLQAALQSQVRDLQSLLSEMKLAAAEVALTHRETVSEIESRLAVAVALADQRQSEIERLHGLCQAHATQVPGVRMAIRRWITQRLAA